MIREIIDSPDYLQIVAVKKADKVKRYEIVSKDPRGFYRISEEKVEKGKVCFPGVWSIEKILSDITRAEKE